MPSLSIVLPTKNEEKYLPKLLDSIKNQTFKDYEIIVADANSTDRTKEIARKYGCKIIKGGVLDVGRNNGAKKAKANLLCFIDADIILPNPEFIKKAIEEFERRKLDLAGTLQKPISTKNKMNNILYKLFYEFANISMILSETTRNPFMQTLIFMKKQTHKEIGGFPPVEFGEDSAFAKKAVKKGKKFGILIECRRAFISPRRLEKDGFFRMLWKYIYFNTARTLGYEFERGKTKLKYW